MPGRSTSTRISVGGGLVRDVGVLAPLLQVVVELVGGLDGAQVGRADAFQQRIPDHRARTRIGVSQQHRRYQANSDESRPRRSGDRPWPPRHMVRPRPFCLCVQGSLRCRPITYRAYVAARPFPGRFSGCTTKTGRPARGPESICANPRRGGPFGRPALPFRTPLADVAQLVEHFTRNEGVPGSSPGVGLPDLQGFLDSRSVRALLGGTGRVPVPAPDGARGASSGAFPSSGAEAHARCPSSTLAYTRGRHGQR